LPCKKIYFVWNWPPDFPAVHQIFRSVTTRILFFTKNINLIFLLKI
jgi:hypothetical protein